MRCASVGAEASPYVDRVIADASALRHVRLVIGLLSWFWLGSLLVLLAAEVNVVLVWRLWSRSLAGEAEPADRRALRRLAESTRRDRGEEISVAFKR
jgi:membrane protein